MAGRQLWVFVFSGLIVTAGFVDLWHLRDLAQQRVASGSPVTAEVLAKPRALGIFSASLRVVEVRYSLEGQQRTATLGDGGFGGQAAQYSGLVAGDRLTVYVHRKDSSKVATESGLVSEGRRTFLPWLLWLIGASAISFSVARNSGSRRSSTD